MNRGAYLVLAVVVIFFATIINYSLVGETQNPPRSHGSGGGSTIFIPGGGTGWHK